MDDQDDERHPRQWRVDPEQTKTIELDGVEALNVHLIRGRVDVIGTDDDVTRLEIANVQGVPLGIDYDGHSLNISHPNETNNVNLDLVGGLRSLFHINTSTDGQFSAEVSLLVPRGIRVAISMVGGDTLISGVTQGASLSTVSGLVIADGITGDLKLNNVSGKVEARNHHGGVTANTVSGEVVLSGELTSVKSHSVSGDQYIDAFGTPRTVECNAVSGNLAIRLDPDLHVIYKVSTLSGKALISGNRFSTRMRNMHYEDGPAGGSSTRIVFDAVSGKLKAVRRTQPCHSNNADSSGGMGSRNDLDDFHGSPDDSESERGEQ